MVAQNCSEPASVTQTCQCEKSPLGIGNWPIAFRSAASRQRQNTQASTAAGVSKDAIARAMCWFLRGFCRTLAPEVSRILTTIRLESQFTNSHSKHIVTPTHTPYANDKDCADRNRFHGKSACRESAQAGYCRNCGAGWFERRTGARVR